MEIRFEREKLPALYHALSPEGKQTLLRAALYFHRITLNEGIMGASQEDCAGFLRVVRKAEQETGIPVIGERMTSDDVLLFEESYREALEEIAQVFYDVAKKNENPDYQPPRQRFERFDSVEEANAFLKAGKTILVTDFRMRLPSKMAYPSGWTEEMIRKANQGPLMTDAALSLSGGDGGLKRSPGGNGWKNGKDGKKGKDGKNRVNGKNAENGEGDEENRAAAAPVLTPVRVDYLDLREPYGWTYRLEEDRGTLADFLHLPNYREAWKRRYRGKELQQVVIAPGTPGKAGRLLERMGFRKGQPDHYFILYRMKR